MESSIVEWFGLRVGSKCGYCKSQSTKVNHGMWAHSLSCKVYEELLDQGWRRSGMYCYKPVMNKTCCPQYAIRCDATQVKLSKSQKKVIRRFNNFLVTGKNRKQGIDKVDATNGANDRGNECLEVLEMPLAPSSKSYSEVKSEISSESGRYVCDNRVVEPTKDIEVNELIKSNYGSEGNRNYLCKASEKRDFEYEVRNKSCMKNVKGPDPDKPLCRKAKLVRQEKKLNQISKLNQDKQDMKNSVNKAKSLEDIIDPLPSKSYHAFETMLISVSDKSFEELIEEEFELFCKYQQVIHGDLREDLNQQRFRRFLVDGPLQQGRGCKNGTEPSTGFGAFHYRYFLDGKLIAVGVIDILPSCVSSKYFFYDPDYSFLSLGTYSALREIYLVRLLSRECPTLKYYYMGYFIANCPKMNYKAQYSPSYLLCPETYLWQPIEMCLPKLSISKYSRLEKDESKQPPPAPDINSTLILYSNREMNYATYKTRLPTRDRNKQELAIQEYSKLVGRVCLEILLYRS